MPSFRALAAQIGRDVGRLHDFLWTDWNGDAESLRVALMREARGLDAFLGAKGSLRKPAETLAEHWGRGPHGAALFELLHDTYRLTAASERVRTGDPKGAGRHVASAVESLSIGLCSAGGRFDLVEGWEGRPGSNFETYMGKVADFLDRKGVGRAGEYKRLMLAAWTVGGAWDGHAPAILRRLAARGAIENGAWCAVATGEIRRAIGAPRLFSEKEYGVVIERIVTRL